MGDHNSQIFIKSKLKVLTFSEWQVYFVCLESLIEVIEVCKAITQHDITYLNITIPLEVNKCYSSVIFTAWICVKCCYSSIIGVFTFIFSSW